MTISTRSRGRSNIEDAPNKRQKVEEHVQDALPPEEAQPVVGERHASLWFDEGNVVLAARGKSFKLHSGVLAHHSKVFKDILSAAALANLQERLDGCPVLRTDDIGDVLAQLLQIIYDGGKSGWFGRKREVIKFHDLRSVTLIAAKYQVQEVLDEAKDRLRLYYPTSSLEEWRQAGFHDDPGAKCDSLCIRYSDSIAVVHLCRLLGAHEMLPVAFYECCRQGDQEPLVRGVAYDEEVVRLSEDDMLLCLVARHRLIQESAQLFKSFIDFRTPRGAQPCSTQDQCRKAVKSLTRHCFNRNMVTDVDPLASWSRFLNEDAKHKPCTLCRDALQTSLDDRIEAVWRKLGKIFHVDCWPPNDTGRNGSDNDDGAEPQVQADN